MDEIGYVVYHNKSGYYVKWKDKGSDEYSDNYIRAKIYKTITPAISRLGIPLKIDYAKKYIEKIEKSITVARNKKLSRILGQQVSTDYSGVRVFDNGKIEMVKISKGSIINLGEVNSSVYYQIFKEVKEKHEKKFYKYFQTAKEGLKVEVIEDDNFWN